LFATVELSNPSERVLILLNLKVSGWWAAYHGIYRSAAVKILPVTKLRIGNAEHTADLLWLIKLSLIGQFISTDKILFEKKIRNKNFECFMGL